MELARKIKEMMLGYPGEGEELEIETGVETEPDVEPIDRGSSGRYGSAAPDIRRAERIERTSMGSGTKSQILKIHEPIQMYMVISFPETIEDAAIVCDYLRENKSVIVNLEAVDFALCQRIVDFLSGVIYAVQGEIQTISNKIFVLAPANVEITGHIKEELKANELLYSFRSAYR